MLIFSTTYNLVTATCQVLSSRPRGPAGAAWTDTAYPTLCLSPWALEEPVRWGLQVWQLPSCWSDRGWPRTDRVSAPSTGGWRSLLLPPLHSRAPSCSGSLSPSCNLACAGNTGPGSGPLLPPLALSTPAASHPVFWGSVHSSGVVNREQGITSWNDMLFWSWTFLFKSMPPYIIKLPILMLQLRTFSFSKYSFLLKYWLEILVLLKLYLPPSTLNTSWKSLL